MFNLKKFFSAIIASANLSPEEIAQKSISAKNTVTIVDPNNLPKPSNTSCCGSCGGSKQ